MSATSSNLLLLGGSALIALSFVLGSFARKKSSLPSITDLEDEEFITEDDVVTIFKKLFDEMQEYNKDLSKQIQQYEKMAGPIPEPQRKNLLRAEMEKALVTKQKIIIEQFGIDYDCLEEATWEFLENEDKYDGVKKAVESFQKLWENATGDKVAGWRPGKIIQPDFEPLTPEKTLQVAESYYSAITKNMKVVMGRYEDEGKNMTDSMVQQQMLSEFQRTANEAGNAALLADGVTHEQFERSIMSHSNDTYFTKKMGLLHMKQQQDMIEIQSKSLS